MTSGKQAKRRRRQTPPPAPARPRATVSHELTDPTIAAAQLAVELDAVRAEKATRVAADAELSPPPAPFDVVRSVELHDAELVRRFRLQLGRRRLDWPSTRPTSWRVPAAVVAAGAVVYLAALVHALR